MIYRIEAKPSAIPSSVGLLICQARMKLPTMNIMPTAEYRAQKLDVSLNEGILCMYNCEYALIQKFQHYCLSKS